jgi:hypothetical protein
MFVNKDLARENANGRRVTLAGRSCLLQVATSANAYGVGGGL